MITALHDRLTWAQQQQRIKAIMLCAQGDHFSFGASVEEHQRDQVAQMLPRFHALVETLCTVGIPTFAVLRGNRLGGGLELVAGCTALFVTQVLQEAGSTRDKACGVCAARFTVSAVASWGRALELLCSGRTVNASEALGLGLLHLSPKTRKRRVFRISNGALYRCRHRRCALQNEPHERRLLTCSARNFPSWNSCIWRS